MNIVWPCFSNGFQPFLRLVPAWLLWAGPQLESMMDQMRQEMENNPPLPGAYTPKRGDVCAAKFSGDGQWCATLPWTFALLILHSLGWFRFEQFQRAGLWIVSGRMKLRKYCFSKFVLSPGHQRKLPSSQIRISLKKIHAHLCGDLLLLWPEASVTLEVNSECAFHTSAALQAHSHKRPCGIRNHCPVCRFHQYFCSGHHFSWLLSPLFFFKWPGFFVWNFSLGAVKFPRLVSNWILMSCQPQRKFP